LYNAFLRRSFEKQHVELSRHAPGMRRVGLSRLSLAGFLRFNRLLLTSCGVVLLLVGMAALFSSPR
jgi:hypothetical protein